MYCFKRIYNDSITFSNHIDIYFLAKCYKNDKKYRLAIKLYELAIEKGNTHAMNDLGCIYAYYDNNFRDYEKAIKLFKLSIEKGCNSGISNLGCMYTNGLPSFPVDTDKAIEIFKLGIERRSSVSIYNLGNVYYFDEENKYKDKSKKAIEMYSLALECIIENGEKELDKVTSKIKDRLCKLDGNYIVEYIEMKMKIKKLEEENERLRTHISCSPDGELYLQARKHFLNKKML